MICTQIRNLPNQKVECLHKLDKIHEVGTWVHSLVCSEGGKDLRLSSCSIVGRNIPAHVDIIQSEDSMHISAFSSEIKTKID